MVYIRLGTRYGKAAFGILLLQDLAVVPLLIVVELLGKGGSGMGRALAAAGVKAVLALSSMSIVGRRILDPIFTVVAKSKSQEAFLSVILTTVLLMSFVTQGIGLSNTLGAFLAGLLLAETRYHYQIEADVAPFRGLLLGFFFISVGFSIDIQLLIKEARKILLMLVTLVAGKAGIITVLSVLFGVPFKSAQQTGLLCGQSGEFAFVAFGIADKLKLLPPQLTKVLLTTVALSMAITPAMAEFGNYMSKVLDNRAGMSRFILLPLNMPLNSFHHIHFSLIVYDWVDSSNFYFDHSDIFILLDSLCLNVHDLRTHLIVFDCCVVMKAETPQLKSSSLIWPRVTLSLSVVMVEWGKWFAIYSTRSL